ncbi:MAG: LLM class F420-dependent oxidoreductase, partial [Pseudomonadales bacterium]|nr:LLM class F420-dependent oxidoreductase [Pseudomonadales bacterium]
APGYAEMISEAGFAELVDYARSRPHPKELLARMPAELMSAIGLVGSESAIAGRLEQYRAAGADEICLVPATAGDEGGLRVLEAMSEFAV